MVASDSIGQLRIFLPFAVLVGLERTSNSWFVNMLSAPKPLVMKVKVGGSELYGNIL